MQLDLHSQDLEWTYQPTLVFSQTLLSSNRNVWGGTWPKRKSWQRNYQAKGNLQSLVNSSTDEYPSWVVQIPLSSKFSWRFLLSTNFSRLKRIFYAGHSLGWGFAFKFKDFCFLLRSTHTVPLLSGAKLYLTILFAKMHHLNKAVYVPLSNGWNQRIPPSFQGVLNEKVRIKGITTSLKEHYCLTMSPSMIDFMNLVLILWKSVWKMAERRPILFLKLYPHCTWPCIIT